MHDLDRVRLEMDDEWVDDEGSADDPAGTLLGVTSGEELEEFLGGLVRSASRLARRAIPKRLRTPLVRYLKGAATAALPGVGAAVGDFVGSHLGDAKAGARAGRRIARALTTGELEAEGADGEYEAARQVVDLAERLAGEASRAPADMATVVRRAEAGAGLTRPSGADRRSGTWTRSGRTITVHL